MKVWIVQTMQPHPKNPRQGRLAVVTAEAAVINDHGDLAFYQDGLLSAGFAKGAFTTVEIAATAGDAGVSGQGWDWHDELGAAP